MSMASKAPALVPGSKCAVSTLDSSHLPHLAGYPLVRGLCRLSAPLIRKRVLYVEGIERLAEEHDPFILVANHNHRLEAVFLPAVTVMFRQGKMVHFMADWPMMLIPGVGSFYRDGHLIPVFSKNARPPMLNRVKNRLQKRYPFTPWERASELLQQGKSVGIYPEGTMNRDPDRLLRGRTSAARLALTHDVPVVPVGIRFPQVQGRKIQDDDVMTFHVGTALRPSESEAQTQPECLDHPVEGAACGPSQEAVERFHARMMSTISELCGKTWSPDNPLRRS